MSDQVWIIKEGLEIFGPFNQAEIIAHINNKEILETDQIAAHLSKFQFMKNCEEFSLLFSDDDDEIQGVTKTEHTTDMEDINPSVTGFLDVTLEKTNPSPERTTLPERLPLKTNSKRVPIQKSQTTHIDSKTLPDTSVLVKKKNKYLQASMFLVSAVIVAGCVFYYMQFLKQNIESKQELEQRTSNYIQRHLKLAILSKKSGDLEESKQQSKNILNMNLNNPKAFFNLVETFIMEKNYQDAREELENKLQDHAMSSMQHEIYNYLALIDLENSKHSQAESNLKSALAKQPSFVPAIVNQGTFYFLNEAYDQAEEAYKKSMTYENIPKGMILLHRVSNAVEKYGNLENNSSSLEKKGQIDKNSFEKDQVIEALIKLLQEYRQNAYNFKLESILALALLHYKLGNEGISEDLLKSILELDLDLTDRHFQDVRYFQEGLIWANIEFWFQDFNWSRETELLAVQGFLIFKRGDEDRGMQIVEEALKRESGNYKIQTLHAYLLSKKGFSFDEELKEMRLKEVNFPPQLLLSMRMYMKKENWTAVQNDLNSLRSLDAFPLQVLTGLAQMYEEQPERSIAKRYFTEAKKLSQDYKPLLSLEAKWASE